jgi:hypothetical protein
MTSRVIAVAGTSHSPMVTLDPGLIWPARALTDVTNPLLYDTTGVIRTYDEHVAAAGGKFDRELDTRLVEGMRCGDLDALSALPANRMNSGTSEGRNWLVAAGAGGAEDLKHQWSEYIPAYRSPAGTGIGLAFGLWS